MCSTFIVKAQRDDFMFSTVNERDGLPSDQINCLAYDDFGYIWIGCKSGLTRYNGYGFITYNSSNNPPDERIEGNAVSDIKKDLSGFLWIATENGATEYNPLTGKFTHYTQTEADGRVNVNYQVDRIIITADNKVYIFSNYGHLYLVNRKIKTIKAVLANFFENNNIRYCYGDGHDNLWALSENDMKIYKLDTTGNILNRIDCSNMKSSNPTRSSYTLLDNGNGEIYFGGDNGLIIFDEKINKFKPLNIKDAGSFPSAEIKVLFKDHNGDIWVGTNAKELHLIKTSEKRVIKIKQSYKETPYKLNSPTVTDIIEDKNGIIWMGTWKGLSFMETNPSKTFHNVSSDENTTILFKDYINDFDQRKSDGLMALASDGGGLIFWYPGDDKNTASFDPTYMQGTNMDRSSTLAVAFDKEGNCYHGGYNRRFTKVSADLKTNIAYPFNPANPESLQSNFTADILCDKKNRIWVLTNGGGLHLFNPKNNTFKQINEDKNGKQIISKFGLSLSELPDGKILVGTYQGLSVYDPDANIIKNHTNNDDTISISHNWIYFSMTDSKQRIWIGTASGLNLFDVEKGTFKRFSEKAGFENIVIKGITEDKKTGYLWISTAHGLVKFNPETGKVLRIYKGSDGLLAENFEPKAAFCDLKGFMYFGTGKGFTYFRPEDINCSKILPIPTISGLLIDYKSAKVGVHNSPLGNAPEATDIIVLNNSQSTFTIEFATLNYVNAGGNRYSCFMKGYDKEWNNIGARRDITFTNLNPGKYVFMVKCTNADGLTSDIRQLKITVLPPWYGTWWAIMLELFFFACLIMFIYYLRIKALKLRQKELEETVVTRTQELRYVNQELELQKEEVLLKSEEITAQRDELVSKNQELECSRAEIVKKNDEISKSLNSMLILNSLGQEITSTFETETIINTVYKHVNIMVKCDSFAIGIYSKSKATLDFCLYYHDDPQLKRLSVSVRDNYCESYCFNNKAKVYLDSEGCENSAIRDQDNNKYGSCFCVPLITGEEITGVMAVNSKSDGAFGRTDVTNLEMIAGYVSIAMQKADAYQMLRTRNNSINGSIRYAKTIQDAILLNEKSLNNYFESFVYFKPKDIVSGDFYWVKIAKISDENGYITDMIFAAVVDCTGHGVPGAFMSLISNILLNDIVRSGNYEPATILEMLAKEIISSLNQNRNFNGDGLDISLCRFDKDNSGNIYKMIFAGAKNSIYYYDVKKNTYEVLAADRISIGSTIAEHKNHKFSQQSVFTRQGDIVYMITDGIIDQNNKERKRFGRIRFIDTLKRIRNQKMSDQKIEIVKTLEQYAEKEEQRDDITVMGIRL